LCVCVCVCVMNYVGINCLIFCPKKKNELNVKDIQFFFDLLTISISIFLQVDCRVTFLNTPSATLMLHLFPVTSFFSGVKSPLNQHVNAYRSSPPTCDAST